ncbi:TPA: ead/Ea22-like family protein [Klebsiella pneumoniae]
MTTDITELAQSLKNAASKALIEEGLTWFSEEQLSHEDGIALHKADAEFIALANPANVLALVEALEKSEKTSEARREAIDRTHNMFVRERDRANAAEEALEKAQQRIAELDIKNCELDSLTQRWAVERAENADRIAELESRTVKLPAERFCPAEYAGSQLWSENEVWNKAITACADELRAAGIKVEAE